MLNVSEQKFLSFAFGRPNDSKYYGKVIKKRNGGDRSLLIPVAGLKSIQRKLVPILSSLYIPHSRAHGYIQKKGLRTNASPHIGKKHVLNVDLVDFFGTITFPRIRGRLMAAPYNLSNALATTLARIVTCDGKLPAGAPTSPVISNIMCSGLDSALAALAKSYGCFYTRYADDLTFSSNRRIFPHQLAERVQGEDKSAVAGPELINAVTSQGFSLNETKTRLLSTSDSQEVCGVICNERLNIKRKLLKEIRGALHAWRKFGLDAAEQEWNEKFNYRHATSFEMSLRGKIEFMRHIRGEADAVYTKYANEFNELSKEAPKLKIVLDSDWKSDLIYTSCIIESYMSVGTDLAQGSGFVIDDGYIVTNRHVIFKWPKKFDDIMVRFPQSINLNLEVEVVADLEKQDLALLRLKDDSWRAVISKRSCKISTIDADKHDVVWLTGWPNYQDGDELHMVQGEVTSFSNQPDVRVFRISPNIVFGNSGGPIFNEQGEVVGIATYGSSLKDAAINVHNGCVPASLISSLIQTNFLS